MDPVSQELKTGLLTLGLANDRDLLRCRSQVRRLANGLPSFDSVWIDVLVRQKMISNYQGDLLANSRWQELLIGDDIVLVDQFHHDRVMPLFLAEQMGTKERFFVTRVAIQASHRQEQLHNLEQLIRHLAESKGLKNIPIQSIVNEETQTIDVVSPVVTGDSLQQLLVRRGRFPETVVLAIAHEISKQLRHAGNCVHGDLRISNVLLSSHGEINLINHGILAAFYPEFSIHIPYPDDWYDCCAPEKLTANSKPTLNNDLYAFGCLLWQLLTGRPPHYLADPLQRIAAHQQKEIADVRQLAPDTSNELAELIKLLTHRRLEKRPENFAEVLERIAPLTAQPRKRLHQFVETFESAAPRNMNREKKKSFNVVKPVAVSLFLLVGLMAFWNRHQLGFPQLQSLAAVEEKTEPVTLQNKITTDDHQQSSGASEPLDHAAENPAERPRLQELPEPDEFGIIRLSGDQSYVLRSISRAEQLSIQSAAGQISKLVIDSQDIELQAKIIELKNLNIRYESAEKDLPSQLSLRCDQLVVSGCHLQPSGEDVSSEIVASPCLRWSALSDESTQSGRILLSNSVNQSGRTLLTTSTPVSTVLFQNVFNDRSGHMLECLGGAQPGLLVPIVLNQCSHYSTEATLLLGEEVTSPTSGKLSLQGQNSIFDMPATVPLIELATVSVTASLPDHFEIYGQGLFVDKKATVLSSRSSDEMHVSGLLNRMRVEGLISGEFEFRSETEVTKSNVTVPRLLVQDLSVRTSEMMPGFDMNQFVIGRSK